jgi:hypothetical protein
MTSRSARRAVNEPRVSAAEIESENILQALGDLKMYRWRYIWEHEDVQHIGPTAQDFHATFGLGRDDRFIEFIDGFGVALISCQALRNTVAQLERRIEELESTNPAR